MDPQVGSLFDAFRHVARLVVGALVNHHAVRVAHGRPQDHPPELGLHFDRRVDVCELGLTPSRWLVTNKLR
jgi:hypothetical protein